jgi:mannose-6-phosphate isomerase
MNRLYPYLLTSKLVPAIWGGDALATRYGKTGGASDTIGESWECWADNVVSNGVSAGSTLSAIWAAAGPALLGLVQLPKRAPFPVLTKFIDARDWLSVQVHPDDNYAQTVEHQNNGKTECWVILEAAPDAEIVLGFSRDTNEAEVRKLTADGRLNDVLRHVKVKAGDVFFLPAGTVHAIGAGIVLFETQQASELTYRLFDWNRKGIDGKPRELHIDKAAAVLNYQAATSGEIEPLEYRFEGGKRRVLITDERFGVEELIVDNAARFYTESVCTILTTKETAVRIRTTEGNFDVGPWSTIVVPAGVPRGEVEAEQPTSVFMVTPPGARDRLVNRLELIGFDMQKFQVFDAQFARQPTAV